MSLTVVYHLGLGFCAIPFLVLSKKVFGVVTLKKMARCAF